MKTGKQILQARKLLNVSREFLAEKSGVGRSTLQRIEDGNQNVTVSRISAAQRALEEMGVEFGEDGWVRLRDDR